MGLMAIESCMPGQLFKSAKMEANEMATGDANWIIFMGVLI